MQDAWTINNKLTINAGVRTERERVPYYAPGQVVDGVTLPEFGIEFGFADKVAPRVGFAYDINGDGRWKAFGSWGVFYDIFKLELPRGSFGGDKWLEYYYTLDTLRLADPRRQPGVPAGLPGHVSMRDRPTSGTSRSGANAIDPDLKPMRQQEATAGIEHQLNDVMSLSVRYVHKQIDRAIEDTQTASLDADGNEIYIIANPGEGLAEPAFSADPIVSDSEAGARLRQRRVRVREAVREQLVSAHRAICGAGCSATTRVSPSRTRTAAPARTSAGCTTTR